MDSPHDRRADDQDGARTVSNWELMMLSQEMKHKLEEIAAQISRAETATAERFGEIKTWQGEYQTKVDTNSEEITKLREHYHQMTQTMQTVAANSVLLPTETRRELVRLLPWAQNAAKHLEEENLIRLDQDLRRKAQREIRWFGMSREIVLIALAGIFVLLNSPVAMNLWRALTGG